MTAPGRQHDTLIDPEVTVPLRGGWSLPRLLALKAVVDAAN
jgi:hypothetical protein